MKNINTRNFYTLYITEDKVIEDFCDNQLVVIYASNHYHSVTMVRKDGYKLQIKNANILYYDITRIPPNVIRRYGDTTILLMKDGKPIASFVRHDITCVEFIEFMNNGASNVQLRKYL